MESRYENVTPTIAMKWLESMNGNRHVRQSRVDDYAGQMKAGLWRPSPQGIIFDTDGQLVDGQHRLWAIVESGCTVKLWVTRGMNPDDVALLDTGLSRNYADTAHYAGWESADPAAAAIAKVLVVGVGNRARVIPAPILQQWVMHYKDAVEFACRIRQMTRGAGTTVIPYGVAAPFARAYYSVDKAVLERFGEIVKTGVIEHAADRAAIALRDAWLTKRLGRDLEAYQKTEAAIRAFTERRGIKTLQRAESELFDIPKLPAAMRYEPTMMRPSTRAKAAAALVKASHMAHAA